MAHNPFFYQPGGNPFMQGQLLQPNMHMQALLQPQKGFPLMAPQQSILGAPPQRGGIPMNPFLNAGLLNRNVRGGGKPIINQAPYRAKPSQDRGPVENSDVLAKLTKLIPHLGNAEGFISNAKQFNDLLNRGLNKQTAANFYAGLEALSANIGKEEFNTNSLWRIFEFAFLKKTLFSGNVVHLENITKWKHEADVLMMPKGTPAPAPKSDRKHPLLETPTHGAKRARIVPFVKSYNLTEVGQQVEVLQEELVAVREEVKALRDDYRREVDFLYQHLGVTPPAPPTPPPEPEIEEVEVPVVVEAAAEPAETAAETTEDADAKPADADMVEPAANGDAEPEAEAEAEGGEAENA